MRYALTPSICCTVAIMAPAGGWRDNPPGAQPYEVPTFGSGQVALNAVEGTLGRSSACCLSDLAAVGGVAGGHHKNMISGAAVLC